MIGIDFSFADITVQMISFWSIPVVGPMIAAPIAIGIIVLVANSLRDLFSP